MTTSVFVTGATGFIAQHVIKLLISKGYRVIGTVRSAAKGEHLANLFGTQNFAYEVVSDFVAPGAFDNALKNHPEATVFIHTASPVNFQVSDIEAELLKPAVEGTKNVFAAIKAHDPQVKHVVVTSSAAAHFDASRVKDPTYTITEESWNPITWEEAKTNPLFGYFGSKKYAEQAAWDFFKEEKPGFSLNTISPVYVFGPQAFDSEVKDQLNFSAEVVNGFLKLTPESSLPDVDGQFIDVRDVARAHLAAFEGGFSGKRLLLVSADITAHDLLKVLKKNFESLQKTLPSDDVAAAASPNEYKTDTSKTKAILGFEYVDLETSIVDSVSQILAAKSKSDSK